VSRGRSKIHYVALCYLEGPCLQAPTIRLPSNIRNRGRPKLPSRAIVKHPIHTALQILLSRPRLPDLICTNGEDLTSSLEYSSVWIAGHSVGGHIASSIALDAPAPNITLSKPERDPSTLSQIIGVIGIEGIYDS